MFNSRQAKKKRKPYQVKKTGVKDENIDRQILVIHMAIANKLLIDNRGEKLLVEKVLHLLEKRREEGRIGYGEYVTWLSAMEIIEQRDDFIQAICEDSPRMRKLRRKTPFVGILTEEERQAALDENSLGTLDDLSSLF